jgi:pyruvate ferredoxin oxidoreductase gamma subunit
LGGFAALSGLISLDAVTAAIRKKFSGKLGAGNAAAATAAFELVERETTELTHA